MMSIRSACRLIPTLNYYKGLPCGIQLCRFSTCSVALQHPEHPGLTRLEGDIPPSPPRPPLPLMTNRKVKFSPKNRPLKQAWLETLSTVEDEKLGIVDLHPDIFATFPRIDILWWNIHWQSMYRKIRYDFANSRAEMKGGGRKPWPQKGSGRARHGSIRSPLWKGGGKAFGPRGPESYFFMLSVSQRVLGLRVALSVKYAQDSLHIVDSLDLPSDNPEYIENLIETRGWGLSVLFIDDTDVMPQSICEATGHIKQYNIMPVYGLNVHSILKHETLVLTLAAVEKIEEKLLFHMHKQDYRDRKFTLKDPPHEQPHQPLPK